MIKLTQLMNESEEKRPLSNEVKKHFMEIVSTYNKYQESMDRKSDIAEIAETLGGITEAARTLAIHEAGDWFDKHTVKRNMSELDKLGKQFDKVALEAKSLDQRMGGLYEDMGHILSRYYKIGEISEEQMKERLGMNESKEDCGCGCNGTTEGGCNESVNEAKNDNLYVVIDFHEKGGGFVMTKPSSKKLADDSARSITKTRDITKREVLKVKDARKIRGLAGKQYLKEESLNEEPVSISMRNDDGSITTTIKEVTDLNEQETALYEFGVKVEKLMEKSCPNDAGKWAASKAAAKKKFDVYPSAYANGWAAKNYKGKGGTWKNC